MTSGTTPIGNALNPSHLHQLTSRRLNETFQGAVGNSLWKQQWDSLFMQQVPGTSMRHQDILPISGYFNPSKKEIYGKKI